MKMSRNTWRVWRKEKVMGGRRRSWEEGEGHGRACLKNEVQCIVLHACSCIKAVGLTGDNSYAHDKLGGRSCRLSLLTPLTMHTYFAS